MLSLMPLDTFVPAQGMCMQVVGDAERVIPLHERLQGVVYQAIAEVRVTAPASPVDATWLPWRPGLEH
ncbi:MAG: hypothetical protein ACRYHQ_38985 [Janthinobacterium lividum]